MMTQRVIITKDHFPVLVMLDTLEMELHVEVIFEFVILKEVVRQLTS